MYAVIIDGLSSADIGKVIKIGEKIGKYYPVIDCDIDAIHKKSIKQISKEEYDLFLPRNKFINDFKNKID